MDADNLDTPYPEHLHYVELMLNSAFYGVYAVLIVLVIYRLVTHPKMPLIHQVMFWAGIFMFLITTVELGLVLQQVTVSVVPLANARAQVALAIVQFIIGDTILIWRVWAVWNRRWWVTVLPILLMLAAAGARIPIILSTSDVRNFVSDIASILLLVNIGVCTLLIGGRIWFLQYKISKSMNSPIGKTYQGVLLLLIESGSLIFLSQLLAIILSKIDNDGVHAVLDIQIPLTGMIPTLIVLLVHMDMVPGARAQEEFQTMGQIEFRRETVCSHLSSVPFGRDIEIGTSRIYPDLEEWQTATRSKTSLSLAEATHPAPQ